MHAQILEYFVGIMENIHQVGNGSALIAAHITHAGLQQRLGDTENSFAVEFLAGAHAQLLDLFRERSFRHDSSPGLVTSPITTLRPNPTHSTDQGHYPAGKIGRAS